MPVDGTKYSALPAASSVQGSNEFGVNQAGISRKVTLHQIWSGSTGGLTQGAIPFAGSGGVPTQDASNLFWDNTNKRLGIGTTGPTKKLTVGAGGLQLLNGGHSGTYEANSTIIDFDASSSVTRVWSIGTGTTKGRYDFHIRDGSANDAIAMVIDNSGKVGIGTTTPSYLLQLSQDSAAKPSTNTWTVSSDRRLKTNIQNADLERCYEIVKSIPLRYYRWRDEVYSAEQVQDRGKLGWIADEVQAVFPKAVNKTEFVCPPVEDGIEEYDEPVMEEVPVEQTSIEIVNGVPTQVTKTVTQSRPVVDDVPVVDTDGNPVMQADGTPLLHPVPRTRKATRPKVRQETIQDCLSLNADQLYAAMYGAIQYLQEKVERLEAQLTERETRS
jgi:hypothetical protein